MSIECVRCDGCVEQKNRRLFHGIAMRLFVSAQKNMSSPESGSIYNTCRMCYRKWHKNDEFVEILDLLEEESNEMIVDSSNKI